MQYENMIGLIGTLKQIEKIDEVNGLSFNGYKAIVTTERTSGAKDDAIVLITEETMRDNRTGLPKEGEAVMIAGSVQTHKNFGTGKVLVYALAAVMEIMTGTHWQYENEIKFTGKLGKGINYRATPNGRKITDVFVKLPCDLNNTIKGVEGEYWEYWKRATGAVSPQAQYGTYPERITYGIEAQTSAQNVRVRSAYRGNGCHTWNVGTSGYVGYYSAYYAWRCAPACVIC